MSRLPALLVSSILVLSAFLLPNDAYPRTIDRFMSGSWYNPAQAGHGFSIEVSADGVVVIYWYTYHPDGTPMFILAVGQAAGMMVTATAYYNTGMQFGVFDPDERVETVWGTLKITFHDCNTATVEYDSNAMHGGTPYGSGSFPVVRLVSIDHLQCQEDARAGIYEGIVFSEDDGRTYYGFVLVAPGGGFAAFSEGGWAAFGDITVNGKMLEADGEAVSLDPANLAVNALDAFGEFSAEYRLFTVYELAGGDEGYGDFYASAWLYRRGVTLSGLAGNYEVFNPFTGFAGEARIMNNGNLTGEDELGCRYAGQVSIPDVRFNLFEISVTVSSCPGFNGTYEGLGEQIDWFLIEDRRGLRVLASDGNWAFLLLARK